MSDEYFESTHSQIRDIISRLQSPIQDLPSLLALLAAPLAAWKILPPRFVKYNVEGLPTSAISISKHAPLLQRALLESVLPSWAPTLDENDAFVLVLQYFSPDSFSFSREAAKELALYAYSTILSLPITEYSVRLLAHLCRSYPIDVLWTVVVSGSETRSSKNKSAVTWEDCVRNVCAVPAKVANALGPRGTIPRELEYGTYFDHVGRRCQVLFESLPETASQDELSAVSYLLSKLVNIGVFPPTVPISSAQPSFFNAVLPSLRSQLDPTSPPGPSWSRVFASISSISTLQNILVSLLSHLIHIPDLDDSPETRALVKCEATLLAELLGPLSADTDIFDGFCAAAFGRQWSIGHTRILACWGAGCGNGPINAAGLEMLLAKVVSMWTMPDHIRHALLSGHQYFTAFFLIIASYLSSSGNNSVHSALKSLSHSAPFINSITTYISHLDPSVRRCGMLVAEEVARATGMKLDFGDWDGDRDNKPWCRKVRELMKCKDTDADISLAAVEPAPIDDVPSASDPTPATSRPQSPPHKRRAPIPTSGYDSDDSLTGYMSSPSSSRSPSPTPSDLAEIEKDPTVNVGRKKITRPVYLAQLGEMVRSTSGVRSEDDSEEPRRIEVALEVAEELIRRKRAYGTELEENAVNLAYGFLGLQDAFDLEGFDEKRLAALTALVACCPQKAAQSLIEEFFKNQYSTDQRFAVLNALVFGARELAGLPIPSTAMQAPSRIAFPSKQLPPALHQKYLTRTDETRTLIGGPVQKLLEDISTGAIARTKQASEDKLPEPARERRLRIKKPAKISEVSSVPDASRALQSLQLQPKPVVAYTEVAAEHFICPLMNRFWLFLRDEQTREARTAHQPALHQYRAAGTGLILNALVLSQFMGSLAILVHMARNAREYLAIIAPDALELAITVGTRPLSQSLSMDEEDDSSEPDRKSNEAAVLTASLELAVIVIDGCLDLDDGKSLGLEHTALLLAAGEWAGEVLSFLEKGEKALGGGGSQEVKLRRAAAGLALKVDELSSRWRRSMIGL